jgi:hypothetical protein
MEQLTAGSKLNQLKESRGKGKNDDNSEIQHN